MNFYTNFLQNIRDAKKSPEMELPSRGYIGWNHDYPEPAGLKTECQRREVAYLSAEGVLRSILQGDISTVGGKPCGRQ